MSSNSSSDNLSGTESGSSSDTDDKHSAPKKAYNTKLLVPIYQYCKRLTRISGMPCVILRPFKDAKISGGCREQMCEEIKNELRPGLRKDSIIHELGAEDEQYKVFVVTGSKSARYVFLNLLGDILCLRIGSTTTRDQVSSLIESFSDAGLASQSLSCASSNRTISVSDLYDLPNLSTAQITSSTFVTWTFCYQCTPDVKHDVKVTGLRTDSLRELKQRFLQAISTDHGMQADDCLCNIWFVLWDEVLTDEILQKTFGSSFTWPRMKDLDLTGTAKGCKTIPIKYKKLMKTDRSIKVHVYFKPADAITKQLLLKKAPNQRSKQQNMTIVISRNVTKEQLRTEISQALRKKRGALKIKVGDTALEEVSNLQEKLCALDSRISVRICSPEVVPVHISHHVSRVTMRNKLNCHPFDTVEEVKSQLSALMHIPDYKIDLTYQGQTLKHQQCVNSFQMETGTELEALVFGSRSLLKLHILGWKSRQVAVLVDDMERTTVQDLKALTRNAESAYSSLVDSEILVIFQSRALCDNETLSEAGISPTLQPQTVLIKCCQSLCFSSSSTAPGGTFITFQDDGQGSFTHKLTMASGPNLFTANKTITERYRKELLCAQREYDVTSANSFTGLRVWRRDPPDQQTTGARCRHVAVGNTDTPTSRTTAGPNQSHSEARSVSFRTDTRSPAAACEDVSEATEDRSGGSQRHLCADSGEPNPNPQTVKSKHSMPHATAGSGDSIHNPLNTDSPRRMPRVEAGSGTATSQNQAGNTNDDASQAFEMPSRSVVPSTPRKRSVDGFRSPDCSDRSAMCKKSKNEVDITAKRKSDGKRSQPLDSRRQSSKKTTVIEEIMEESDVEGEFEFQRRVTTKCIVSGEVAADVQMALAIPSTSGLPPGGSDYDSMRGASRVMLSFSAAEQAMMHNAKFKYIDKKIIFAVAKDLGSSGRPVILQLDVPDPKVLELENRYGVCSTNCHLLGLMAWCEMAGEKANPDNLKKVLDFNHRRDLVDLVDDILSGKTGYKTS